MKITSALILLLVSTGAQAKMLHLMAQGYQSITEVAPLYHCIAYQGCNLTEFKTGADNRIHIYTTQSLRKVNRDLEACDLSAVHARGFVSYDEDDQVATPIDLSSFKSGDEKPLNPAVMNIEIWKKAVSLVSAFSANKDRDQATQAVIDELGINTFGYKLIYVPNPNVCVTFKESETIQMSGIWDARNTVRAIRHEFEHVRQNVLSESCPFSLSTFDDHVRKERAAYLNDAVFYQNLNRPSQRDWALDQIRTSYGNKIQVKPSAVTETIDNARSENPLLEWLNPKPFEMFPAQK